MTVQAQGRPGATADRPADPAGPAYPPPPRAAGIAAAVVAGGLGGLAYLGQVEGWAVAPAAAGLFAVQVVLALAWVAALDAPGSLGAVAIAVAAAGTGDALVAGSGGLASLAAVLGLAFLAALGQQLFRRPRPRVVASAAATVSLVTLELAGTAMLALRTVVADPGEVIATGWFGVAAALLTARVIDAVARRPPLAPGSRRGAIGALAGLAAAGAAGAAWSGHVGTLGGAGAAGIRIAIVAAVVALVADLTVDLAGVADLDERPRSALPPLVVTLPAVLAGPAVYVAARYLLG